MPKNLDFVKSPSLCTDIVVFTQVKDLSKWKNWIGDRRGKGPVNFGWHVLLIGRKNPPYAHTDGYLCIPGGFINCGESPEKAASRELEEETGISNKNMQLVGVYGNPSRDPRGHAVSIAYSTIIDEDAAITARGADDAWYTQWMHIETPVRMGFDHRDILQKATDTLFINLAVNKNTAFFI